jgi:hypothetical protein
MKEVQEFILRRAMQKVASMQTPLRAMGRTVGQVANAMSHEFSHAPQINEDETYTFGSPELVPHEETHSGPPAWLYDIHKSRQPMHPNNPSNYYPIHKPYDMTDPATVRQMRQQYFEKQQQQQQQQRINNSYKPV